jgi:glucose-6-phosphate isomerase
MIDRMKGKGITVMMPYGDALRAFSEWFCQLWAESLGKRRTPSGDPKSPVGQTPVRAVGATDQHSQLQLYVEGPNDKLLTLISVDPARTELMIPRVDLPGIEDAGLAHLGGRGIELLSRSAGRVGLDGRPGPPRPGGAGSRLTLGQLFLYSGRR